MVKGARRGKFRLPENWICFLRPKFRQRAEPEIRLHTLTEVVLKNPFAGIRRDSLRTQSAAYFVELIEICTERDHREPELFGLLRRAFGYLDANDRLRVRSRISRLS